MTLPAPMLPPLNLSSARAAPISLASLTVMTPTSSQGPTSFMDHQTKPSRWRTLEFRLYEAAALTGIGALVFCGLSLGPGHPNFDLYAHRLRRGWIGDRLMDVSDAQYSTFRGNLGALIAWATAHLVLGRLPIPRILFLALFAVLSLSVLHGFSVLKILVLLYGNFCVSKYTAGTRWGACAIWVYNSVVLLVVDYMSGGRFGALHDSLSVLDEHGGMIPRWYISFNITALRLISYGIDHHWAVLEFKASHSSINMAQAIPPSPDTERQRAVMSHPLRTYESFTAYVAYVLYAPLYVAGPILSFNNFHHQILRPTSISRKALVSYSFRFLFSLLTMEVLLQFIYVVALKDVKVALRDLGPGELLTVGFWNLIIVWLKLLLPWRFFRLWSLIDGIDPPENMVRCMANNYSCHGFWRAWHRSYNLWLIRYIYVPLGGAKRPLLSTLVVFTFVALWHDLSFTLLTWGWLVSLVVLPEVIASHLFPREKYGGKRWYRHAVALGGLGNVLGMTSVNLVGFVIGVEGMWSVLRGIWGSWHGVLVAVGSSAGAYAAVHLMMEYREEEHRRGIWRKY